MLILGDWKCVELKSLRVRVRVRCWEMQEVPPKGEVTPIPKLMTRDKGDKRKLVEKLELKTEETELV